MKKILHIPNYYNPHIGGIEKTCEDIVSSLKEEYEQRVICFKDSKHTEQRTVNDINVTYVGCQLKVARQSLAFSYNRRLKEEFVKFKPDIVIFHYPNPFVAHFLLRYLKKYKNVKFILYWHLDITKQKIIGKLFNHQSLKLLKRADKVIATSYDYAKHSKFLPKFMDKVTIVPSCVSIRKVDNDKLNELVNKIKVENDGKKIVFSFGRHVKHKGFNHMIDAARLLPNYNFYLGGTGDLSDELREQSKDLPNFKMLGKLDDLALEAYLNSADVFVFPSLTKSEAFGLALAEALMHSLPCVTFTIPGSGVNYVSQNNVTGIECANGNSVELANALDKILSDDDLRNMYSNNAKERAFSLFSYDAFKKEIRHILENIN